MIARFDVNELRRDADSPFGSSYATFENILHAQSSSDYADVHGAIFEGECGGTRGNPQIGDLRQAVQELLGKPIGEVLVFRIIAEVFERENRDRGFRSLGNRAVLGSSGKDRTTRAAFDWPAG